MEISIHASAAAASEVPSPQDAQDIHFQLEQYRQQRLMYESRARAEQLQLERLHWKLAVNSAPERLQEAIQNRDAADAAVISVRAHNSVLGVCAAEGCAD